MATQLTEGLDVAEEFGQGSNCPSVSVTSGSSTECLRTDLMTIGACISTTVTQPSDFLTHSGSLAFCYSRES